MKKTAINSMIFGVALTLFANVAFGELVVDQISDAFNASNNGGELGGPTIADFQTSLQSFTVGVGGFLDGLDLQVMQSDAPDVPTDPLVLSILGTTGGIPDFNQNLGSVSLPASSIPTFDNFMTGDFIRFDVSGLNIAVTPGDVLSFAVSYPTGSGSYFIYDSESDIYAGGTSFVFGPLDGFFAETSPRDLGFRTIVAVPEPSAFYTGLFALLIGISQRGRRKAPLAERKRTEPDSRDE